MFQRQPMGDLYSLRIVKNIRYYLAKLITLKIL